MTLTSTTLAAALSERATLVPLTSLTGISVDDLLVVGTEAMLVQELLATPSMARVMRGAGGTPVAPHAIGTTVYAGPRDAFFHRDPEGVPPSPLLVSPWINLQTGVVWTASLDGTFWTHQVLDSDGTTAILDAAGDVVGPDGATSGNLASYDGTTGLVLADSGVVAADIGALLGAADGLASLRVARATFDPSATAGMRTIAAHTLGVTLPDNAIVCGGFVDVITTFTSATDAATIALHAQGANDLVSAIAINNGGNPWDAGLHAIVPKANTPESTGIKLSAARALTATVAVEALTAGKAVLYVYYLPGV